MELISKSMGAVLATVLTVSCGWARPGAAALPTGYTALDWIESSGEQSVDTGVKPRVATPFVAEMRGAFTAAPKSAFQLFGALPELDGHVRYDFGIAAGGCWTVGFTVSKTPADLVEHLFRVDFATGTLTIDGKAICADRQQPADSTVPFELFARHDGGTGVTCPTRFRLRTCRLTQGGVVVRDFVPCRSPSGEAGLWDHVTARFYGNRLRNGRLAGSDEADASGVLPPSAFAPPGEVRLANTRLLRVIDCRGGHVVGRSYRLAGGSDFMANGSPEFSLLVNGRAYSGTSRWKDVRIASVARADGGRETTVSFAEPGGAFRLTLAYTTYLDLPLVRKTLEIANLGDEDLKVEAVNVEDFFTRLDCGQSETFRDYGRHGVPGPYAGNWGDPLVIVHELRRHRGIALGNETIGVVKRTATFVGGRSMRIGTTTPGQPYPFRRWLKKGQSWRSAAVFTAPYAGRDPQTVVNTTVQDYVRKYMGARVARLSRKPLFAYNTWIPFGRNIDEKKLCDVAEAAAACGVEEFVIDDGWQVNPASIGGRRTEYQGDWVVDSRKFPNGLKPVFDHVRALGMKPGLWISMASADSTSRPHREHPEWLVRGADGRPANLHGCGLSCTTCCMGTGWYGYIRDRILALVREHGLAYVKLDFAVATSPYVHDDAHAGCYATDHPGHRDRAESFDVIYERMGALFDELHRAAPGLYIDCTYEAAGKLQLMDYGFARHADGNWLSNIEGDGFARARYYAWVRTPALPPASLVIGNIVMNAKDHLLGFKSLAGALPMMLGDPRRLTAAERAEYRAWADWLKALEVRHGFMAFRQDLPGFGEPGEGRWDGFGRINTETKSGGLVGVFRENAVEPSRRVTVAGLDPNVRYAVRRGPAGAPVAELTGHALETEGFAVAFGKRRDGELFEIDRVPPPQQENPRGGVY